MAEVVDPYLDPDTGLLRNLVGARTQSALDAAEGALVFARAVQLVNHPVRPTGDLDEFRAIHRHLFQDVYDWAGKTRTVDIRKNVDGAEVFLPVSMIDRATMFAAEELRRDNMLSGMNRDQFIDRLSYHYDQWTTSTLGARETADASACSGAASPPTRAGIWIGGRRRAR